MKIEKIVGQILHDQRTARHYTQKLVAKTLGIQPSTYANYENGNRLFPAKYVSSLASKLKFDISKIVELHPRINADFPLPDEEDDLIIIDGSKSGVIVAKPAESNNHQNPIISYLASEGYDLVINDPTKDYLSIKTNKFEISLNEKELEELKENVTNYIEFELYKKRNQ